MNRKIFDPLLIIILIFILVILTMALLKMREEGTQCSVNPLKYGVQQIEKENDALFQCTCGLDGGTPLILDNTGLRTLNFP